MAARLGAQNREWVREYAHQAQQFATRFPQEDGRTAVSLISAGRKCEQYGLILPLQAQQMYRAARPQAQARVA